MQNSENSVANELIENENYSQMKNNIIDQSSRIAEILNHAGKFRDHYDELNNNIIDSMNSMIKNYVKESKKAILYDIFDGTIDSIKFDQLKSKFAVDVKADKNMPVNKFVELNLNDELDNYDIEEYDTDILVNMSANLNEKSLKKYVKFRDQAIDNLSDTIDSLTEFENNLCALRSKVINEQMNDYVNMLYAIHVNYARAIMKKKAVPDMIKLGKDKQLKLVNSQRSFITSGLKVILGIE